MAGFDPSPVCRAIHEACRLSGRRFWFAAAGGGQLAHSWLLSTPGASASVIGALVPYAFDELEAFTSPVALTRACSPETAQAMALSARSRACKSVIRQGSPFRYDDGSTWLQARYATGVACTATLATSREHFGQHRAHVCVVDHETQWDMFARFDKSKAHARGRFGEERILST
jgi:hypothetical protein